MRTAVTLLLAALATLSAVSPALAAGGDDVSVLSAPFGYDRDLAVASDGTLFAIVMWDDDSPYCRLTVRRSLDGGTTWADWATFNTAGYHYWQPTILVAEGVEDRVVVGYVRGTGSVATELRVAWSPLGSIAGDFSHDVLLASSTEGIQEFSLVSDALLYSGYNLYLAYSTRISASGQGLYFRRSTTQGSAWEDGYLLMSAAPAFFEWRLPRLAAGFGGYVHLAVTRRDQSGDDADDMLCYQRASARAASQGSWSDPTSFMSNPDGVNHPDLQIGAALTTPQVLIASVREQAATSERAGFVVAYSGNAGENWGMAIPVSAGAISLGDLRHEDAANRWCLGCGETTGWGFRRTSPGVWNVWGALQRLADTMGPAGAPALILDPGQGDRIGLLGCSPDAGNELYSFDAEWRADPGYPNLENGFPVDLAATPLSDPAVVDVDGDGDLEIAFTDSGNHICMYRHDGTPLPGWPVLVGATLSPAPVAIGDMDGDGDVEILAGTTDAHVVGYDAGGQPLAGFPVAIGRTGSVYVTIAPVGGPWRRAAIVAVGSTVVVLDHEGQAYPGTVSHSTAPATITSPPAVGDIDGDGRAEVVVAASGQVWAFRTGVAGSLLSQALETTISGGIALADFDADGEVEIVAPLANGVVHVLQEDGTEFAGSWPVAVSSSSLRGVAIADIRSTATPEVAVTATNWTVGLLNTDGTVPLRWPNDTDGWYIYGKPVIGRIVDDTSSVVVGSRGYFGWAWTPVSLPVDGWPRTFADHVHLTPAYGDLDQDGRAEVVFLTQSQLAVLDVVTAPGDARSTWPMSGHDAGRSGCWECVEYASAVGDEPVGVARVSFASPWPNPVTGPTTFDFALPAAAVVELAVYDLRGCRLAVVERSEQPAGRHRFNWNGRDRDGHPLGSGHYLARLRVRGPGVDETLTRKFTVVH